MMIATGIGFFGIFAALMLIFGIVLTVITMKRMHSGKIAISSFAKFLVCAAMIAMLVIQIFAMLPPDIIHIDNPFVEEHYHTVTPESIEAAP